MPLKTEPPFQSSSTPRTQSSQPEVPDLLSSDPQLPHTCWLCLFSLSTTSYGQIHHPVAMSASWNHYTFGFSCKKMSQQGFLLVHLFSCWFIEMISKNTVIKNPPKRKLGSKQRVHNICGMWGEERKRMHSSLSLGYSVLCFKTDPERISNQSRRQRRKISA